MPFLAAAIPAAASTAGAVTVAAPAVVGTGATVAAAAAPIASTFSTLSLASMILEGASTLFGAFSKNESGKAQQEMLDYQARQAEVKAGQERASSQRKALAQRKAGDLAESNAIAAAAAGGGSISDPTVMDIVGDIEDESQYRSLTALYEGEDAARGLETQADIKRYEGKVARSTGRSSAIGTLVSGAGSMIGSLRKRSGLESLMEKYGGYA